MGIFLALLSSAVALLATWCLLGCESYHSQLYPNCTAIGGIEGAEDFALHPREDVIFFSVAERRSMAFGECVEQSALLCICCPVFARCSAAEASLLT